MKHLTSSPALALGAALALSACNGGSSTDAPPDPFESEEQGGRLHNKEVASHAPDALLAAAAAETGGDLGSLSMNNFDMVSSHTEVTPAGIELTHLRLQQQVDGIPVENAYVSLTASSAGAKGPARLLASSYRVFHGVRSSTTPAIPESKAHQLARASLRTAAAAPVTETKLVLYPNDGKLDLVYSVLVEGSYFRALVYANGPLEGRVIRIDERHYETTGTVTGQVAIGGAPGGAGVPTELPLANTAVGDGTTTAFTGADGTYSIDVAEGTTLRASLTGPAGTVADQTGLDVAAEGLAGAVTNLALGDAANDLEVADVTAFFFTNKVLKFLNDNGINEPALENITINVNINDVCNAFFTGNTINFFQAGAIGGTECNNTAEATIVMHEYGHHVDSVFGGITNGGMSEGWGDLLACFIQQNPDVGPDLFVGDSGPLRTCDNDYQFPPGGNDAVHNLGQAWSGFAWHAREGLIAELGEEEGDALARALFLPSFPSNATDIPAGVREVFIRDDDDGDLENETPHWDILLAAAEAHSLGFVVDEDLVAPSQTTDLAAAAVTATTATLTWTAPGDDKDEGTADRYDLRRSAEPITESNFAQAQPIAGPTPLEAGQTQEVTVAVFPGETVFFALRTFDEQQNGSPVSNVIEVTADEGQEVFSDSFENGGEGWEADGLWHVTERRASDGDKSFWYGQEETGNYDTGAANSGTLTSPVIDLAGFENPALAFSTFFDVEPGDAFDKMTISVFDADDPEIGGSLPLLEGNSGDFISLQIGLGDFSGRRIHVQFTFDTVDEIANELEGWFIDDFRVVADGEAAVQSLVINEVLADPGNFDANGDGNVSFEEDEFIELVNSGDSTLDLSGVTIEDKVTVRFTFPNGASVAPGGVVVVFGGGTPPEGMNAFIANKLFLNNTGDELTVRAPNGAVMANMTYGAEANHNQSLTKSFDGDVNSPYVKHLIVAFQPASPGLKLNGSPFEPEEEPAPASLIINEVLADPAPDFDANGDGVLSTTQDEFIELLNVGGESLDLSGAIFSDAVGPRLTIPAGTVIEPGGALIIFGGGSPSPSAFPGVQVVTGNGQLFLNNSGDTIIINSADGTTLSAISFGGASDQSLVRETEGNGNSKLVPHTSVSSAVASPGTRADGTPLL